MALNHAWIDQLVGETSDALIYELQRLFDAVQPAVPDHFPAARLLQLRPRSNEYRGVHYACGHYLLHGWFNVDGQHSTLGALYGLTPFLAQINDIGQRFGEQVDFYFFVPEHATAEEIQELRQAEILVFSGVARRLLRELHWSEDSLIEDEVEVFVRAAFG